VQNHRKIDRQATKAANFDDETRGRTEEKKEGCRISGHPSRMSLSEEGSSVSCIAFRAGNRSNFF